MPSVERLIELLGIPLLAVFTALFAQWRAHRWADQRDRKKELLAEIDSVMRDIDAIADEAAATWLEPSDAKADHERLHWRLLRLGRRLNSITRLHPWFVIAKELAAARVTILRVRSSIPIAGRHAHVNLLRGQCNVLVLAIEKLARQHRK